MVEVLGSYELTAGKDRHLIQWSSSYGYSQQLNPKEAELRSARYPSPA